MWFAHEEAHTRLGTLVLLLPPTKSPFLAVAPRAALLFPHSRRPRSDGRGLEHGRAGGPSGRGSRRRCEPAFPGQACEGGMSERRRGGEEAARGGGGGGQRRSCGGRAPIAAAGAEPPPPGGSGGRSWAGRARKRLRVVPERGERGRARDARRRCRRPAPCPLAASAPGGGAAGGTAAAVGAAAAVA